MLETSYSLQADLSQNSIMAISDSAESDAKSFVISSNVYRNLSILIIFSVILIIILIANLVGNALRNSLLEGINNIKNISKNLLDGNLKINSTYTSNDEIGEMSNDLIKALKMLTSYINDITNTLERLSNSDLNVNLNNSINYIGDFSPIKESLDKIVTSLNVTFYDMRQSIKFITSSSEQLSTTTQILSEGSAERSQAVEDLLSSFNKILTQVQNNTDHAYNANKFSDKTKNIVSDGSKKMDKLMNSMNEITISSKKIAKIISTIEDIAS